jgi:hypothetical protein
MANFKHGLCCEELAGDSTEAIAHSHLDASTSRSTG